MSRALFLPPASKHPTDTSWVNELFFSVCMLYVAWKKKEDFLEKLHVLSYLSNWTAFSLISCVFWTEGKIVFTTQTFDSESSSLYCVAVLGNWTEPGSWCWMSRPPPQCSRWVKVASGRGFRRTAEPVRLYAHTQPTPPKESGKNHSSFCQRARIGDRSAGLPAKARTTESAVYVVGIRAGENGVLQLSSVDRGIPCLLSSTRRTHSDDTHPRPSRDRRNVKRQKDAEESEATKSEGEFDTTYVENPMKHAPPPPKQTNKKPLMRENASLFLRGKKPIEC